MEISDALSKQDHLKQIIHALYNQSNSMIIEYQEENQFNEERMTEISEMLGDFINAASEQYPDLQNFGSNQENTQGELKAITLNDKNH